MAARLFNRYDWTFKQSLPSLPALWAGVCASAGARRCPPPLPPRLLLAGSAQSDAQPCESAAELDVS
jgi:hypothetical protein